MLEYLCIGLSRAMAAYLREAETVYEERRVRRGLRIEVVRVPVGTKARTYRDVAGVLLSGAEYQARFGAGLPR